ncbi:MAG: indole-3-glycerol phosphate synthase TrpC [Verrucomicrobiota bacterium]|nr:indole-3-glycerol phosphate synthase TrpC [Verrucomicrobiota bacterium]
MDKLDEIMAWKRREVAERLRPVRTAELEQAGRCNPNRTSFRESLLRPAGLAVISEIKRRSPSAGQIATLPVATEQAIKYYNAGTDCISVLTDEKFFGGSIKDLWEVHDLLGSRADAPGLLRKDFFVHPIQVLEAAEAGAKCILIIVRCLSDAEMRTLFDAANTAGLDSIFEVHNEPEIERAVHLGARIIGVNNRDLAHFRTDLGISERLIPLIPKEIVAIGESGIWTVDDAARMRACGAKAVLVGEALMRAESPDALITAFHQI